MELFLNLCWLSLLLPAYLLWRQRAASTCSRSSIQGAKQGPAASPLIFLGILGCILVLLFPVISATDDLHAMRPEMEESERAFRDANRSTSAVHALTDSSQPLLPWAASLKPVFEQMGTVRPFVPPTPFAFSIPAPTGRAPPVVLPASL
ncbi:MAG: hypothetical protein WBW53_10855 [Terriglobales bacterium]